MDVLWPQDVAQWCSTDFTKGLEVIPFDEISNDDEKSSSYRSGSVVSGDTTKSRQRSRTDLSVLSQSNGSCYSRFSRSEQVPSAQSEGRILDLLAGSGYPMTQVNGQRKLGPPPGWTKPPPEPECEIFVGKIPRELHEDTLYPIFSSVGQIYEIRLMMDFSGSNRGYCFIMFTKVEYAQRAIKELNNFEIRQGHKIGVVASINNCRLCIGQLPAYINSEIVITTFYDLTDEVNQVSVYKHTNGQVRYALVCYRTHRGAAMARRRLLPERATLFEGVEVSIDWAHPGMTPNNVIEESGTRDESGVIHISRREIGQYLKRSGSQRRGRDDFLDKSIKNYLQEKNMKKNQSIQRNECSETTGRIEKSSRCQGAFGGRQKTHKSRSNHQKFSNEVKSDWNKENTLIDRASSSPYLSLSGRENYCTLEKENRKLCYPKNRDVNGNIESSKSGRVNGYWESLEKRKIVPQGHALSVIAKNFLPKKAAYFELFGDESNNSADGFARGHNLVPNYSQAQENIGNVYISNPYNLDNRNFSSVKCQEIINENVAPSVNCENGCQITAPKSNGLTNFGALHQINQNENFPPNQEDPRVICNEPKPQENLEITKENECYARKNAHEDFNFCQACHDQARYFLNRFNFQRAAAPIYRHGTHVFDNYFRGLSGRSSDRESDQSQYSIFPLVKVTPQRLYSTSSFAGYNMAPVRPDRGSSRSILGRMSMRNDDNIYSSGGIK